MTFQGVFGAAKLVTLATLVAGRVEMLGLDVVLDPGGVPGAVVTPQLAPPAPILTPRHVGPHLIILLKRQN